MRTPGSNREPLPLMSADITIVTYHYVRELEHTRYPQIRGLRTSGFRRQVEHLRKNYHPVTVAEVVHAARTGEALPPRAALLTFDDGLLDHYTNVFPILFDAGIQGAFFPPVSSVQRRTLLDVHRIHFLLAMAEAPLLAREIDAALETHRAARMLSTVAEYRAEWAKPSRYDPPENVYVKRMLQVALPEDLRELIAKDLFRRFVAVDEAAFAHELYVTAEQLKVMQASGMYIGSHGDSHVWLNSCDAGRQQQEVDRSLDFLREIGSPVDAHWIMCYPYGGWDEKLLDLLRSRSCALGLTIRPAVAQIGRDDPLLLPRRDTNDFPA